MDIHTIWFLIISKTSWNSWYWFAHETLHHQLISATYLFFENVRQTENQLWISQHDPPLASLQEFCQLWKVLKKLKLYGKRWNWALLLFLWLCSYKIHTTLSWNSWHLGYQWQALAKGIRPQDVLPKAKLQWRQTFGYKASRPYKINPLFRVQSMGRSSPLRPGRRREEWIIPTSLSQTPDPLLQWHCKNCI